MKTNPSSDQVSLFRRLFVQGQTDYYGTYFRDSGRYMVRKEPITDQVIRDHLAGNIPLGVFPLVVHQTAFAVVDFDAPGTEVVTHFRDEIRKCGFFPNIERSKGKGYHGWFFFQGKVEAKPVITCLRAILASHGIPETEVFPKQFALEPGAFGSFVNCPLFGELVPAGRSVFLRDDYTPWPDQWEYLAHIQSTPVDAMEKALSHLGRFVAVSQMDKDDNAGSRGNGNANHTRGLLPCKIRMLTEGVVKNQRLSLFYLAVSFKAAGVPEPSAVAILLDWRHRNHPPAGKTVITEPEVREQVRCAYNHQYAGHGCNNEAVTPFCSDDCILKRRHRPHEDEGVGNRD